MSFIPPVGAATSTTRGLIKLTGDLSGTADSPTVPTLSSKANSSDVYDKSTVDTALSGKAALSHTHIASQISDATAVGQSVMTATDEAAAQLALGIANTVQVVDSFSEVTTPVYGTLYVVRA